MPYSYEYPRAAITTDIAVFGRLNERTFLLLIQRANDPFREAWALPGGFLDMNEDLESCAKRELREETGLSIATLRQLHTFSAVDRDPRHRTISTVFVADLDTCPHVKAGDDARNAKWFDIETLPDLAFDHAEIISMAIKRMGF